MLLALWMATANGCNWLSCPRTGPVPSFDEPTTETRIAAMLAIHANAYWPDGKFPRCLETVPLERAARFLGSEDRDRLAPSRRRRAVGKLAAYAGVGEHDRIDDAIRALGVNPIPLRRAIDAEFGNLRRGVDPIEVETFVNDWIATEYENKRHFQITNPCCANPPCWQKLEQHVYFAGPAVKLRAKISVKRDIDQVRKALDPQKWDECSKFFKPPPDNAYLAKKGTSGPVKTVEVPAGDPYGYRLLYEHFKCNVKGCDAWFKNYLQVKTWRTGTTRYDVDFYLDEAIDGEILGSKAVLDTDGGDTWAEQPVSTGPTEVQAQKHIKFEKLGYNGMVHGSLKAAELAGELAESVCCNIP